ncbi:hypothetical protein BD769DRAFT_1390156 [Suillus cothurnatus]|nr:hypothetical protein BD769DRAFT_1390156 [Suillus cothurnatus]
MGTKENGQRPGKETGGQGDGQAGRWVGREMGGQGDGRAGRWAGREMGGQGDGRAGRWAGRGELRRSMNVLHSNNIGGKLGGGGRVGGIDWHGCSKHRAVFKLC